MTEIAKRGVTQGKVNKGHGGPGLHFAIEEQPRYSSSIVVPSYKCIWYLAKIFMSSRIPQTSISLIHLSAEIFHRLTHSPPAPHVISRCRVLLLLSSVMYFAQCPAENFLQISPRKSRIARPSSGASQWRGQGSRWGGVAAAPLQPYCAAWHLTFDIHTLLHFDSWDVVPHRSQPVSSLLVTFLKDLRMYRLTGIYHHGEIVSIAARWLEKSF